MKKINILNMVKVSRPVSYIGAIIPYMMLIHNWEVLQTYNFWIAFFYLTFPWSFVILAYNDYADYDEDIKNADRGWRPVVSKEELKKYLVWCHIIHIPFIVWFYIIGDPLHVTIYFVLFFAYNALYNGYIGNIKAFSGKGFPYDILANMMAWMLPVYIAYIINGAFITFSPKLLIIWGVLVAAFQMIHSYDDYEIDIKANKMQTCGTLGKPVTLALIYASVAAVYLYILIIDNYFLVSALNFFVIAVVFLKYLSLRWMGRLLSVLFILYITVDKVWG
ncbi:MAG: UbiA family prenyltransferase [bacterium]|nr:UbiA family prenyltransferase [bacterium]